MSLGMWRAGDIPLARIRAMTEAALDCGVNFFDHADIYGKDHRCERRWAEAMQWTPSQRQDLIIQTKAGIRQDAGWLYDFSAKHLMSTVEESLKSLRTDYIDILLLHRPDALMEPEEVAQVFDQLWNDGKVQHFGVSNFTASQIELLTRYVNRPIVANQVQLSLTHCPIIAQGLAANMSAVDGSVERAGGLVEYCILNNITLQAWSPVQAGFLTGTFLADRDKYGPLNDVIDRLAGEYGVEPVAIATAWIWRHPANIQVVLGSSKPERIRAAAAGSDIRLTREQWYELFIAAGHEVP